MTGHTEAPAVELIHDVLVEYAHMGDNPHETDLNCENCRDALADSIFLRLRDHGKLL